MSNMYIFADSQQDITYFPRNTASHFAIKLTKPVNLDSGAWGLAVKELRVHRESNVSGYYALTIDCTQPFPSHGTENRVLRTFSLQKQKESKSTPVVTPDTLSRTSSKESQHIEDIFDFNPGYYMPLHIRNINNLYVDILPVDGSPTDNIIKIWCVLHLKQL
ncbi:MAG: hypothetical protein V3T88_06710 [Nitrosomonadaceae bacterium]